MCPGSRLHPKPVLGVDRCPGAGPHLAWICRRRCKGKVEASNDHRKGNTALKHGERISHALSRTGSEWQESVIAGSLSGIELTLPLLRIVACPARDVRVRVLALEAVRIEGVRVRPILLVPLQVVNGHEEVHSSQYFRFLSGSAAWQRVLIQRPPDEQRRLWVHAQRLRHGEPNKLHIFDVLVGWQLPIAHHSVYLLLQAAHQLWILRQLEKSPGKGRCRRLMPGNQHRDHVVSQLLSGCRLSFHVHEKSQQGRVLHLGVVTVLQLL
mmetsp:Transcript_2243/g.5309  ORF Transcript_2243/g.5309 Transcript_2243/m.5309 type:complete len:267 (+) Transcript_2243:176-976(+)